MIDRLSGINEKCFLQSDVVTYKQQEALSRLAESIKCIQIYGCLWAMLAFIAF